MGLGQRALLGCAGLIAIGSAAPALAEVELTFRYNVENVDEVRAGLDAFEAQNPGIEVTLERIAFKDARDQFVREAAVGVGPDVVHLAFVWVKDLGAAEACLRLNDLIASKGIGTAGWDDFVANDLMYGPDGESIYGVPFTTDTFAMIYRTDVMAESDIEAPPETWEELLEDSRRVKERTGKIGFGFAAGASSANTIWFLANYYWWSNGAALVVEDGQGGYTTGIDAKEIAEAIEYYGTYLDEGLTTEGSLGIDAWNAPEVLEPMLRGEQWAVMVPVFTADQLFADWRARNPGEELPFTTAMVPRGSGESTTHLGGHALCVNASSEHPKEAWKLMQFLNTWEFFERYNTGYYPAQYALLERRPFPPEMKGFAEQFTKGARSWGPYARGPATIASMWNQTSRSFGSAFIGAKTPLEAAEELLAFVKQQL
ncbi:MAG: extracellular solute-binding protein [Geminicoccaceae bacterium]